ncbi:hypothetical protein A2U01_0019859 [Trifolium medium]|uniref:Uncharacterized protein n=1 Tax=Trifolium medium TaxID=97028 RepID=A0A392NG99_9FABA|nr:hypothetical protein [Trifolium medium]
MRKKLCRRRRQAPPSHREPPPELSLGRNSLLLAGTSLPPTNLLSLGHSLTLTSD